MIHVKWPSTNFKIDLDHENDNIMKNGFTSVFSSLQSTRNAWGQNIFFSNSIRRTLGSVRDGNDDNDVNHSGLLSSDFCPTQAFSDSFARKSRFNCLFFSPASANSILSTIIRDNNGGFLPLNTWVFNEPVGKPLRAVSQYVSVSNIN